MNAPGPDFPDAIIRLIPELTDCFSETDNKIPRFAVKLPDVRGDVMDGIQNFSIHVQLKLLFRRIPGSNRFGIAITRKPIECLFLQRRFAVN